jgi:6-phosphogluconolactonase
MAGEMLRITGGPAAGKQIQLGSEFQIGRSAPGDGSLGDDPELSRSHAKITRTLQGKLLIEDLGSTNGTAVNGTLISGPTLLNPGDTIAVGGSTLSVTGGTDQQPTRAGGATIAAGPAASPRSSAPPNAPVASSGPGAGAPPPGPGAGGPGGFPPLGGAGAGGAGGPGGPGAPGGRPSGGGANRALIAVGVLLTIAVVVVGVLLLVADDDDDDKAAGGEGVVGAVYTQTNGENNNELLVYNAFADGRLEQQQRISTGGRGGKQPQPGCDPPDHKCPFLDAQNEVVLTDDGRFVFAVNAGSNTFTSFVVTPEGMVRRVQTIDSGGGFPISIAVNGDVLYVLNTNSENISGFRFSESGRLTPIRGSTRKLTPQKAPVARQIGFDRTGRLLVVSSLTDARFDVFPVNSRGVAGDANPQPSASPQPFAFAFDPRNNMIAVEVVNDMDFNQSSDASSYRMSDSGRLTNINKVPTQGYAGCWTEITSDGRFVFVVNTGGPSPLGAVVTTLRIANDGRLTFLSKTTPQPGTFTLTDEALSRDDRYLYVVTPLTTPGPLVPPGQKVPPTNSKILTFRVGENGALTKVSETPATELPGMSGLAAN